MKLEIQAPQTMPAEKPLQIRVILFNDSYEPVAVSRNQFVGPNVQGQGLVPPHVEATKGQADEPLTLQPFTFYGREREIGPLTAGDVEIVAEYQHGQEKLTETIKIKVT